MQGESPQRLSKIPGFDPLRAEVIAPARALPGIPAGQLAASAIRQQFASPPRWQPEFSGDQFRVREGELRAAAVLIPIVLHADQLAVLLTERTAHLSSHAGQIAFPGGRVDRGDVSPIATALREAQEEVGLDPRHIEVLGTMPEYLTGTGFRVTPVVGLVSPPFELRLQVSEVAEAFEVPLHFLMNPQHHQQRRVRWLNGEQSNERSFYAMPYRSGPQSREYFIWGATAAMLRNLYWFLAA